MYSSYSVENKLGPASVKRTPQETLSQEVLKIRMAEGCSFAGLHSNLLKSDSIRDHFLEIFCKFQSTFNKLFVFSSSFLVAL